MIITGITIKIDILSTLILNRKTAQAILDARALYPNSNLVDMYDKEKMFMYPELVEAHEENDKAVLEAYGLTSDATEIEIIKYLFKIYEDKVESK